MTKKAYNFEVYTCNPATGETGWDIKCPTIFATDKANAREILKNEYPHFDVIILFNYCTEMSESDITTYATGINYRDN